MTIYTDVTYIKLIFCFTFRLLQWCYRRNFPPCVSHLTCCHTVLGACNMPCIIVTWPVSFPDSLNGLGMRTFAHTHILLIDSFSLLHSSTDSRPDNSCKKSLQYLGEVSLQFSQGSYAEPELKQAYSKGGGIGAARPMTRLNWLSIRAARYGLIRVRIDGATAVNVLAA